jgi:hypothetical protein
MNAGIKDLSLNDIEIAGLGALRKFLASFAGPLHPASGL